MDIATFRQQFTEFSNEATYPDAVITFQMTLAGVWCSQTKWGDLYDVGMSLATAHFLTINKPDTAGKAGLVTSESAGDVSVGMDVGPTVEDKGGQWNLTTYGTQFLRMARLIGGCGLQL